MDKFRVQIEALKKYHFWILFGFVVVVSLGCWAWASSSLSDQFDKGKRKLKGVLDSVSGVKPDHPNDGSINELKELIGREKKSDKSLFNQVFRAWKNLYDAQRSESKLPDFFNAEHGSAQDKQLQKAFESRFNAIWSKPIEEIAALASDQGFHDDYGTKYQYHMQDFLSAIDDLIERRRPETGPAGAGEHRGGAGMHHPGGSGDENKRMKGIVDWDDVDKAMSRFKQWTSTPSTLQIMIAQEDLWVYESMLKVIRNTNSMNESFDEKKYVSPGTHQAARVKRILAMEIGQEAVADWLKSSQSVIVLPVDNGAAAGPGGGNNAMHPAPTQSGNASGGLALLANRYVDANGKALEDATQQPFKEFRMMPIFMRVRIEQAGIPRLLAACANSSMRIDVTAVRVLPDDGRVLPAYQPVVADAGSNGAAPGGAAGPQHPMPAMGMHSMSHGGPMAGHGGGAFGGGESGSTSEEEEEASNSTFPTVVVEIHGVVYIYNKPKFSSVGKGAGSGGSDAAAGNQADSGDADTDNSPDAANSGEVAPAADSSKAPAAAPATGAPAVGNVPAAPAVPPTGNVQPGAAPAVTPPPSGAPSAVPAAPPAAAGAPTVKGK